MKANEVIYISDRMSSPEPLDTKIGRLLGDGKIVIIVNGNTFALIDGEVEATGRVVRDAYTMNVMFIQWDECPELWEQYEEILSSI